MGDDAASSPAFTLLDASASSIASRVDLLFVALLALCGTVALGIAATIVVFCVRYRAGHRADRRHPPTQARALEVGWAVAPLLVFIGVFVWAAWTYAQSRRVPPDALAIHVVAKQWMWKLEHANGKQEIDELHVPVDRPVLLILASQDAIHSFFVPAFRLKQDVVPGRYTQLWFTATRVGEFRMMCSEFCGSQHSAMLGRVIVMRQPDYSRWLDAPPNPAVARAEPAGAPRDRGRALFDRLACASCHGAGSSVRAPRLEGLYGGRVELEGSDSVVADDAYLRESIVAPGRRIVRGQAALMPSYADQLDAEQIEDLVAYLRALGSEAHP